MVVPGLGAYADPFDLELHSALIAKEVEAAANDPEGAARADAVMSRVGAWEGKKAMEERLGLKHREDALASIEAELVNYKSLPWPDC